MITLPQAERFLIRQPGVFYAWGYGRQSHRDQIDANEGIPQQGVRTTAYFKAQLEPLGVQWGGFIPDDSPVSARTNPFMLRFAGRTLMTLMREGDHFIVDKVDRLWRSVADFIDVRRMFEARRVTLHICNLMGATSVQLGTPAGDFLMNIMVAGAQMESDQCSDRTRARFAGRRAEGRYPGSPTPLGCKRIGEVEKANGRVIRDSRLFIWCPDQRKFMGEIVRLADEEGMNCRDIRSLMLTHFREFMGERFFKGFIAMKDWPAFNIAKTYWREKQYRALGDFDPNTIKFIVFDPTNITGKRFRDIGRSEPGTPNPYPFLDGEPVPTIGALRKGSA